VSEATVLTFVWHVHHTAVSSPATVQVTLMSSTNWTKITGHASAPKPLVVSTQQLFVLLLANRNRTAARSTIGCWHNTVNCLSVHLWWDMKLIVRSYVVRQRVSDFQSTLWETTSTCYSAWWL